MIQDIIKRRFWSVVADQYVDYLKLYTDMNFKKALDVGALYGQFVEKLNRIGIDCVGIESNQKHVRQAITNKIILGKFDECYQTTEKYDLICLTQMLCYVDNPKATLERLPDMLTDNGIVFVATQNGRSPFFRKYPQIRESSWTTLLEIEDFKTLGGLKLIRYDFYRPEIYLARIKTNSKIRELLNYVIFHFKKAYHPDPDGHFVFILLKKT